MAIIKKKYEIIIDAEFGSNYQENNFSEILPNLFDAIILYQNNSHKNNRITYEIKEAHETNE